MPRNEHSFQFKASEISDAAEHEARYHRARYAYWTGEYEKAVKTVEETIGAKLERQPVTNGFTVQVVIDYGDPAAYSRMQQAFRKLSDHLAQAEQFETDEQIYGTQGQRVYELDVRDVHYYRLGQPPREFNEDDETELNEDDEGF